MDRLIAITLAAACLAITAPLSRAQSQEPGSQSAPSQAGATSAAPSQATPPQAAPSQSAPSEETPAEKTTTTGSPFDRFDEFSAMIVGSVVVGDRSETHIYRSGDLLRTQSSEGLGYYITNLKTIETYGMSLTGCMRDSHPYIRAFPFTAFRAGRKIERTLGGKETVDGHVCQVEDVTITGGGLFNPMKLRFYEAEDLNGFPIKVEVTKGPHAVVRYKDVKLEPQDPTLFIHPNSCKGTLPQPPAKMPPMSPGKKPDSPAPPTETPKK